MPRREWELRIKDILDAISALRAYTEGMKYEAFVTDRKTVDAVIRNLIVIGCEVNLGMLVCLFFLVQMDLLE